MYNGNFYTDFQNVNMEMRRKPIGSYSAVSKGLFLFGVISPTLNM